MRCKPNRHYPAYVCGIQGMPLSALQSAQDYNAALHCCGNSCFAEAWRVGRGVVHGTPSSSSSHEVNDTTRTYFVVHQHLGILLRRTRRILIALLLVLACAAYYMSEHQSSGSASWQIAKPRTGSISTAACLAHLHRDDLPGCFSR